MLKKAKVVLITGAARRVGAAIASLLHKQGMNVIIHYRTSATEAKLLVENLNATRPYSAIALLADLNDMQQCKQLIEQSYQIWQRLDVIVNNASSFFPTPLGTVDEAAWNDLINSNLKAPFFLCQAAMDYLKISFGNIINIVDIHALSPLRKHSVYCLAKAGLIMLTKSLAKELAPQVRVNAIAPSTVLWPEGRATIDVATQDIILSRLPLKKLVSPEDIASTVNFFIQNQSITGQILAVDAGKTI
jgi:pteridine reductase